MRIYYRLVVAFAVFAVCFAAFMAFTEGARAAVGPALAAVAIICGAIVARRSMRERTAARR